MGISTSCFQKERRRSELSPAIFQVPLAQNNQFDKAAYFCGQYVLDSFIIMLKYLLSIEVSLKIFLNSCISLRINIFLVGSYFYLINDKYIEQALDFQKAYTLKPLVKPRFMNITRVNFLQKPLFSPTNTHHFLMLLSVIITKLQEL